MSNDQHKREISFWLSCSLLCFTHALFDAFAGTESSALIRLLDAEPTTRLEIKLRNIHK
jgi:hypothetical protein